MAARRCTGCARSYPLSQMACPVCGAATWYDGDEEPDADRPLTQEEAVLAWRFSELLGAGYAVDAATELAGRTDVDLHRALDLVEHGCAPELAARVLL